MRIRIRTRMRMRLLLRKLLLLLLPMTLGLSVGVGCSKQPASAQVPGSTGTFDAQSYQTLMEAQAALNAARDDISTGAFVPTPGAKKVLNQGIQDYDIAQTAWHAYHAGTSNDQAGLAAAINQVITDIISIADPHAIPPQKVQTGNTRNGNGNGNGGVR